MFPFLTEFEDNINLKVSFLISWNINVNFNVNYANGKRLKILCSKEVT